MRKALIAAGALALALTVGACGDEQKGSPTGGTGNNPPADTTGLFNDAQSLVDAAKEGAAKAKTSKFTMDMNIGPMKMTAQGQAEYAGADTKMQMTMNMGGIPGAGEQGNMSFEMIMIDKAIYMKMPQGLGGGDASKPWIKMSMDQLGQSGAQMEQSMQYSDPTKTLEMIQENGEILNTEQTTVDGAPATKYSVELDVQKLLDSMGQAGQLPGGVKIDKMPMDVYLNAENLPVQIDMDMGQLMKQIAEQSGQALPPGMENAKMVAKYTDWGAPVDIQAPPADQVNEGGLPGMPGGTPPTTTPN